MIREGKITEVVENIAPKIPAVFTPAKVATLTPTGPGVIEDNAIISDNCCDVNQSFVMVR